MVTWLWLSKIRWIRSDVAHLVFPDGLHLHACDLSIDKSFVTLEWVCRMHHRQYVLALIAGKTYGWWLISSGVHLLRLLVYPTICRCFFYIPAVVFPFSDKVGPVSYEIRTSLRNRELFIGFSRVVCIYIFTYTIRIHMFAHQSCRYQRVQDIY